MEQTAGKIYELILGRGYGKGLPETPENCEWVHETHAFFDKFEKTATDEAGNTWGLLWIPDYERGW